MQKRNPTRSYSEPQAHSRRDYNAVDRAVDPVPRQMGKHTVPLRPARSSFQESKAPHPENAVNATAAHKSKNVEPLQVNAATAIAPDGTPKDHKKKTPVGALFSDVAPGKKKSHVQHKAKARTTKSHVLKRDFVEKPHVKRKKSHSHRSPQQPLLLRLRRKLRPTTFAFSMLGAMLMVGASGALIAYGLHSSNSSSVVVEPDNSQVLSTQDANRPKEEQPDPAFLSEDKPTPESLASHQSVDGQPKLLSIPSLELEAKIVPKSVDIGNELLLPENIYDVGWYEASRKPNQPGVVLLHGHVSGPTERGIFYYLRVLEPGDEVRIIDANDKEYTYVVDDKRFIPYDQLRTADLLAPYDTQKDGLNMVAFDTRFNVLSEQFQDRLVVYATAR